MGEATVGTVAWVAKGEAMGTVAGSQDESGAVMTLTYYQGTFDTG